MLTLLFIGLKLTGNITWSWFLVLLPLYAPLIVIPMIIFGLTFAIKGLEKYMAWNKKRKLKKDTDPDTPVESPAVNFASLKTADDWMNAGKGDAEPKWFKK